MQVPLEKCNFALKKNFIMRRRNYDEADYNLLFEKQAKYEETIKSYHEHHTNHEETDEKSVKTEDKDVEAKDDNKQ